MYDTIFFIVICRGVQVHAEGDMVQVQQIVDTRSDYGIVTAIYVTLRQHIAQSSSFICSGQVMLFHVLDLINWMLEISIKHVTSNATNEMR